MIREVIAREGLLTFDDVLARLIEAVQLQWRTESGRWPFASDGPWHLVRKELFVDHDAGRSPARMPRVPLGKADVARMREAFEWLVLVPDDLDRRIIMLAAIARARGPRRVPWRALARQLGNAAVGPDAARMRFHRALGALCQRLNRR